MIIYGRSRVSLFPNNIPQINASIFNQDIINLFLLPETSLLNLMEFVKNFVFNGAKITNTKDTSSNIRLNSSYLL